jgi:uncharacterized membrane protein YfcA
MAAKAVLFVLLALFALVYLVYWVRSARVGAPGGNAKPTARALGIGAFTNFFDTLGIGSFATTTSLFKFWNVVDDRVIPGTLNVGHTVPVIAQAFIYIAIIQVDFTTLAALIGASVLGAWLGAGVVSRWPRRKVQNGMGAALLVAATLMLMSQLQVIPGGGTAIGLTGIKLAIGIMGNFMLGALMTLGIGLYAPCLIMIALLGMSPTTAFPIMMGSCAFLMPVGSLRFVRANAYDLKVAVGLALGGLPAVLVAAYLVKSLPLSAVRWLVIMVVVYTAITMLRAAMREKAAQAVAADAVTAL